jgi:hypothetical protein
MKQGSRTLAIRYAIVATFFILICLPVVQMATHVFSVPKLDENRNRAQPPKARAIIHPSIFLADAQKWFQDSYGLRDFFIRLKTQIDYSVFGVSDKVYVGTGGWLYYRGVIDGQKPAEAAMTDADMDLIVQNIIRLRDYLSARGIKLVVLTNQLKDRFYPQYLPKAVRPKEGRQRFDDLCDRLRAIDNVIYINAADILLPVMKERPIFYKTDFHWNDPAAFEVAKVLVNDIASAEGRTEPAWDHSLKTKLVEMSGGQAMFLPLFHPPKEQGLMIDKNWTPPAETFGSSPPFETTVTIAPASDKILPPIAIFGDSFVDGMQRAGLWDYFQSYYRARTNSTELKDVLQALPPDIKYFVFQSIEVVWPAYKSLPLPP